MTEIDAANPLLSLTRLTAPVSSTLKPYHRHEGTKAQRKHDELRNYQASNLFMNFFVPEPALERFYRGVFVAYLVPACPGWDYRERKRP